MNVRVEVTTDEHGETRVQVSDPWLESFRVRAQPKQVLPLVQRVHARGRDLQRAPH